MLNSALVRPLLWVAGGAVALSLAGCSNPVDNLVEKGVEKAVEGASGGDVDIDTDGEGGGKVTIKGDDGESMDIEVGPNAEVPDDFPGEIPLPDADLLSAAAIDESWSLSYTVDSMAVVKDYVKEVEGAGYENIGGSDMDGLFGAILTGDTYSVNVTGLGEDDEATMGLIVSPNEGE